MKPKMYCDVSSIRRGLEQFATFTNRNILDACKQVSSEMEDYAKANAPWQDRTGNAREGLAGSSGANQYVYWIRLTHSVHYGVYLERGMELRFEIIRPTMNLYSNRVWEILEELQGRG